MCIFNLDVFNFPDSENDPEYLKKAHKKVIKQSIAAFITTVAMIIICGIILWKV